MTKLNKTLIALVISMGSLIPITHAMNLDPFWPEDGTVPLRRTDGDVLRIQEPTAPLFDAVKKWPWTTDGIKHKRLCFKLRYELAGTNTKSYCLYVRESEVKSLNEISCEFFNRSKIFFDYVRYSNDCSSYSQDISQEDFVVAKEVRKLQKVASLGEQLLNKLLLQDSPKFWTSLSDFESHNASIDK